MAKRERTAVVQLKLRIREELRRELAKSAKANDVSLNSEMANRLQESFDTANVEALLGMLIKGPKEAVKLLTLVAVFLRGNRDWRTNDEVKEFFAVAIPLFLRVSVTGAEAVSDEEIAAAAAKCRDPARATAWLNNCFRED